MNKWSELLIGMILLLGVILISWFSSANHWALFGKDLDFLHSAWIVLKGAVFWGVFFVGLLLVILGISDLKN